MSIRLQVLLDEDELATIRDTAAANRQSVSEWVRQILRAALNESPREDAARKIAVVREAAAHAYPTGDIETLLRDIERGAQQEGEP